MIKIEENDRFKPKKYYNGVVWRYIMINSIFVQEK